MIKQIAKGNLQEALIRVPSSKSISHRALIAAALHNGTSSIRFLAENDDTLATMSCLKHLGASFHQEGDTLFVEGISSFKQYDKEPLDCHESGSTLRFLIPLFSLTQEEVHFQGSGRLMERPLTVYEKIFNEQNSSFYQENKEWILKGALKPQDFEVVGNISSQFITGLLFALPLLDESSSIQVIPPYESKSYVDLTIDLLHESGIVIEENDHHLFIPGNQTYQALNTTIEGDASQAAFFASLGAMSGIPITLSNINHDSKQGDQKIFDIIKEMGGVVTEVEDGYCVYAKELNGITIDLQDCPDLGPILFALATQAKGETKLINIERLRLKESDRVQAMIEELEKLGCDITENKNEVIIKGKTSIKGGVELDGHNDHRIVMALSILASISNEPITIHGCEAIQKSYPTFFEDLKKTGVWMND